MSKTCGYCGGQMGDEDRFCVTCGRPYGENTAGEKTTKEEQHGSQERYTGTWKEEVRQNEASREPLSTGSYFLMFLLMAIPIVNLVFLIYWAVGKQVNVNRKNFSRAALIYVIIGMVLAVVFAVMIFLGMAKVGYSYDPYYYEYYNAPYVEYYEYPIGDDDFYDYLPEGEGDFIFSFADSSRTMGDGKF